MPTGFTYASYQAAVVTQIPSLVSDPNFQVMLPDSIDYVEVSIQRDLDFLAMHGQISLGNCALYQNLYTIPAAVVVLESLFWTPAGTRPNAEAMTPITPASQDYIRAVYIGAGTGPPQYFATVGNAGAPNWTPALQVLLGPAPDATYPLVGYGTERQAPMSETNTAPFIWQNLPDLCWAAAMIFWSSYTHNFGAQADDPKMAMSWSSEYQRLLKSATVEEMRKKFSSGGWTAQQPSALANPRT